MKFIILIIFLLLIPIVSADTTFFDQDDSFIMVPKPVTTPEETTGRKKLNITAPPLPEKNITTEIKKQIKEPIEIKTQQTKKDYTQTIIAYIIIFILTFFAIKHYLKHTK